MNNIISVNKLNKRYGNKQVLNNISFTANTGEVIGVIGTNGAGKSTFLKTLLGLTNYNGDIEVCGFNPQKNKEKLMQKVSFIADTATLPQWITCKQLFDYMAVIHPNFERCIAEKFLSTSNIKTDVQVKSMSKGMVTQLHLAIAMAIKSELLVLDEPTIGLDIVRRKLFYQQLLNDYYDEANTIVITTHQLEEIENILTRVVFIDNGKLIADISMADIEKRYSQVFVVDDFDDELNAMHPLFIEHKLNGKKYLFEYIEKSKLSMFGKVSIPELSDIFIALCQAQTNNKTKEIIHA